jgi:hypothetical protein
LYLEIDVNEKAKYKMGKDLKNYVGAILVLLGGLLMILAMFVPAMQDLCDQNWYTTGSFILMTVGIIVHVVINKFFSEESKID